MLTIFVRLLFIYFLLTAAMRLMGKRQIGEMQLSELIITILLSELASQPILDPQIPLVGAVVPILALLSVEVILSFAVTRLPFLKPILEGKPSILIARGRLDKAEIARVRISLEELLTELRLAGIGDISDVDYAILEQNGRLSVIPKHRRRPPTCEDLSIKVKPDGIAHAVIVDSRISEFDLKLIGRDRDWLEQRLASRGVDLNHVYLFTVDDSGKENLIKK